MLHSQDGVEFNLPTWVFPRASATTGIDVYEIHVPDVVGKSEIDTLRSLNLGVVSGVGVRPAGVVPGDWDGEGAAEWLAGEDVLLAISSTRGISKCIFSVDGAAKLLDWPTDTREIFLALPNMPIGEHEVHVGLLSENADDYTAEGSLSISIRAAHSRPSTGTLREGLMLLPTPIVPTLSELWDGRANVQIVGPVGVQVSVRVDLVSGREISLASRRFKARVPLDNSGWLKLAAREIRGSKELQNVYNEAEALILSTTCPGLGTAELRCEREFTPLRWVVGYDNRNGPFARLVNNSESDSIEVVRYDFDSPAEAHPLTSSVKDSVSWPAGGLLQARIGDFESSVILPPYIRDLEDVRRTNIVPVVPSGSRTSDQTYRLVVLSHLWASASLPADPFAERARRSVLRTITATLVSVIGGVRWSRIEQHGAREDTYTFHELQATVGEEDYQEELTTAIQSQLVRWMKLEPEQRAVEFLSLLVTYRGRTSVAAGEERFAEFLLRLASEPGTLFDWPADEVRKYVDRTLVSPVLIRAARFVVLAIHLDEEDDTGSTFRGWSWK
jgi:hypothetical protein